MKKLVRQSAKAVWGKPKLKSDFIGVQLPCGATATVSPDCTAKTLAALNAMMAKLRDNLAKEKV